MSNPVDSNCIFCKIAAGQIPCFKVYEDEVVLAFLDVGPLVKGHTLVIPKAHFGTVMEAPAELVGAVNQRLPRIAQAVLAATGTKACHILVNNGTDAMQSVPHLHYHILPRARGDGFHIPWNATPLEKSTGSSLASAIAQKMGS